MLGKAIAAAASMWLMCLLAGTGAAESRFIRCGTAGEKPLCPTREKNPGLIIFIHGLTGDAQTTWTNHTTGAYWPQLVKDDKLFDGMDIFAYEYRSSLVSQYFTIQDLSSELATQLRSPGIQIHSYERVVFIAHSLGGVIARKYILDNPKIQSVIKGLFLFASPMNGSSLADLVWWINDNPVIGQLQKPSDTDEFLNTLRRDWINANVDLARSIPTGCAYETVETGSFMFSTFVVDRESVEPLCNISLVAIEHDHRGIVKPASSLDHIHNVLRQWYAEIFPDAEQTVVEDEAKFPVLIASCAVDRWDPDLTGMLSSELESLGYHSRLSRRLPGDWQASYRTLLWQKHEPQLLIIHYSCFQEDRPSDVVLAERTNDFISLLETLLDDKVKILVYSGAFAGTPDFIRRNIPPRLVSDYLDSGRLELLALKYGQPVGSDQELRKEFRSLIKEMLS